MAWRDEPLYCHSVRVAGCLKRIVRALKLGLEDEAQAAGLLHDIGKADSGAQESLRGGRGVEGHEIISAVVANEVLKTLGLYSQKRFIIVVAIMRHHQAMRHIDEAIRGISGWFRGSLEDCGLKAIREIVNELSYESVAMGQINISWPKNKDDLRNRTIELQEEFKNHYVEPGLYLKARALSGALMMTDTYIASLSRGGKPSSYGKEVNLFLRKLCDP
ncbi:MAG: CRISPR-associated endonuclease Cas3'' [Sulfolobales archaeon]